MFTFSRTVSTLKRTLSSTNFSESVGARAFCALSFHRGRSQVSSSPNLVRQRAITGTAISVATDGDVFDATVDNRVVDYGHD
jgi:hypothetical protein